MPTTTSCAESKPCDLPSDRVPRLTEINRRLQPLTGFQAKPVSGYVPGFLFFDCLRRREFPTTITIRPVDKMDYLPEPDIFHDVAGPRPDAHREGICRHAGALRRLRPHGRRDDRRDQGLCASECAA